ncbi:hypothetical protein HK103_000003 [Boothiomyces macroporosus]|uniref:Letm1 RBD domain-containing protein n=1 Tax=Boothiomyces macroporosus TaxID=261099 RepID=A0AAD5UMR0_9FUNG|nr:hypothetical protein HK103_000003 [Boothiomyces macroporosus]
MNQLNLLKNEFKHFMSGILAIGKQTGTTLGHWVNVRETGLVSERRIIRNVIRNKQDLIKFVPGVCYIVLPMTIPTLPFVFRVFPNFLPSTLYSPNLLKIKLDILMKKRKPLNDPTDLEIAKYLGMPLPFLFTKARLYQRFDWLLKDDLLLQEFGVKRLTEYELVEALEERGFKQVYPENEDYTKQRKDLIKYLSLSNQTARQYKKTPQDIYTIGKILVTKVSNM